MESMEQPSLTSAKKKNKSADWFEAHTETVTQAIEEKRKVLIG